MSGDGTLTTQTNADGTPIYILNLGTTTQNGADLSAELGLLNAAIGPADVLSATFGGPSGAPEFVNVNQPFSPVSDIAAQNTASVGNVELTTSVVGTFDEWLTVQPEGSNASGYQGSLPTEKVEIIGTVLPQPQPVLEIVTGTAWGDVHMVTFDGLAYNFQAAGEFVPPNRRSRATPTTSRSALAP